MIRIKVRVEERSALLVYHEGQSKQHNCQYPLAIQK